MKMLRRHMISMPKSTIPHSSCCRVVPFMGAGFLGLRLEAAERTRDRLQAELDEARWEVHRDAADLEASIGTDLWPDERREHSREAAPEREDQQ